MTKRKFMSIAILVLYTSLNCLSQEYLPGEHYFHENEYIEYIHGNFPLILSSPHGGEKKPSSLPDRDCNGCVVINDSFTQELTNEITTEIVELTGCTPYVIINRLHRSKLDANRGIVEGADGNEETELAWHYYHDHIQTAQDSIGEINARGLLIDIHGHAHDIQRLELGYLLSRSELNEEDEVLDENNLEEESSIRQLAEDNFSSQSFSNLLRGEQSLGTLISDNGFPAIPSYEDEFPESDPYFSGGYITQQYGSKNEIITDAIQIECNQDVRFNTSIRKAFAKEMASSIVSFMELHYGMDAIQCGTNATSNIPQHLLKIYPTPAFDKITINSSTKVKFQILDHSKRILHSSTSVSNEFEIDIGWLVPGSYILRVEDKNGHSQFHKIIKIDY